MKIVSCYKLVPVNDDISINGDRTLDFGKADHQVGEYDFNALAAAVAIAAASDGKVTALTAGGETVKNSKLMKSVLARGADEMLGICGESLDKLDSYGTATVLKAAIDSIGDVRLVLCGEGSVDLYSQQVGVMLGEMLGWNTINAADKIEYADGKLLIERALEDVVEKLEVALPAVVSVTTSINKPKVPSMKDILAAGKKPNKIISPDELGVSVGSALEEISTLAPEASERKLQIFAKVDDESLDSFAECIKNNL